MTQHFDGETGEPITPILWCVYVAGPDDVIPAPDRETASTWANRVNAQVAKLLGAMAHPNDPKICASVAPWPWSADAHAEGPSDEYRWLAETSE